MSLFMHFVHLSRGGSLYVCHPVVGTIGGIGIRERKKGGKIKGLIWLSSRVFYIYLGLH